MSALHAFTGPKGWPAVTADPQHRAWLESGKGKRWTCSACGQAAAIDDAGALAAFAEAHVHG